MFRSQSLELLRERLWFALLSVCFLIFIVLYMLIDNAAFFIIGPMLLFFLAITQFPRIYIWRHSLSPLHSPQFLRLRRAAQEITIDSSQLPHFLIDNAFPLKSNISLMACGKSHWFLANPDFIESFSDTELQEILEVCNELFRHSVIQRASLLSALQYFLFFLPWSHHRGSELCFYSIRHSYKWSRLLFERSLSPQVKTKTPRYICPTVLFPALTNYNKISYYSMYTHLRNQWLEHTQKELYPSEDL